MVKAKNNAKRAAKGGNRPKQQKRAKPVQDNLGATRAKVTLGLAGVKPTTRMVSEIVRSVVMPADGHKLRLPFQADQKTAVADFEIDKTLQVSGEETLIGQLYTVQDRQVVVMTGQAGVPWLRSQRLAGRLYGMNSSAAGTGFGGTTLQGEMLTATNFVQNLHIDHFSGLVDDGGGYRSIDFPTVRGAPFTNTNTPAATARSVCAYVPGGCRARLLYQTYGVTLPYDYVFRIRAYAVRHNPNGEAGLVYQTGVVSATIPVASSGIAVAGLNFSQTFEPGFYQFYIEGSWLVNKVTTADLKVGVMLCGTTSELEDQLWPADSLVPYTPPLLGEERDPYTAARVTSCAVLASNASPVLSMEGSVTAARLDEQSDYCKALDSTLLQKVQSAHPSKRYFGLLRLGSYMFSPLETEYLKFRDYSTPGGSVTANGENYGINSATTNIPILYTGYSVPFSVAYYQAPARAPAGAITTSATSLNMRLEIHIEYRTQSPLLELGIARGEMSDVLSAQQLMAMIPYFYENPTHWENLVRRLHIAWRTIRPYAPQLALGMGRAAGAAFPEAAPVMHALGGLAAMKLR